MTKRSSCKEIKKGKVTNRSKSEDSTKKIRESRESAKRWFFSREPKKKSKNTSSREHTRTPRENDKELKVLDAARSLANYILNIKESSLNAYFDANLAKYTPSNETTSAWEKNQSKNRSKDMKMYDSTRVKLVSDTRKDYINASMLKFDNYDTEFILTQYPLPDTIIDFWAMVSQKQVDRIIAIYEPENDDAIEEYASNSETPRTPVSNSETSSARAVLSCKSMSQRLIEKASSQCDIRKIRSLNPILADQYMNLDGWLINTRKVELGDRHKHLPVIYTVEVLPEGCSDATFVRVYNCHTWPSKRIPSDERKLLTLVRAPWKDFFPKLGKPNPVVVVCDLGLDRSACVVLTTVIVEMVLAGKTPDCDSIFRQMRDQRANVFTMSIFYSYGVRAALFYLRLKLSSKIGDELKGRMDDALAKVPFMAQGK